jgi:hypothetical protein
MKTRRRRWKYPSRIQKPLETEAEFPAAAASMIVTIPMTPKRSSISRMQEAIVDEALEDFEAYLVRRLRRRRLRPARAIERLRWNR